MLFHEQGQPYEEIAQALDRPVGTVKTWLHRARLEILERLRKRGMVPEENADAADTGRAGRRSETHMNCPDCRDRLQQWFDARTRDAASPGEPPALCPACAEWAAAARRLDRGLRLLTPPTPPPYLTDRIVARSPCDGAGDAATGCSCGRRRRDGRHAADRRRLAGLHRQASRRPGADGPRPLAQASDAGTGACHGRTPPCAIRWRRRVRRWPR